MNRSGILLAMLWLILMLATPFRLHAWNPDVAYGLPLQRRMCVERSGTDTVRFFSVAEDEECPETSRRYVVVFGKEPRGALALLPIATSRKIYPPLVLSWPERAGFNGNPLWHFTCVQNHELSVLESKLTVFGYRGEITSNGAKDCLEAQTRALKYCQEEWQGNDLLEKCPLSWGVE